jgi:hypothetical protein
LERKCRAFMKYRHKEVAHPIRLRPRVAQFNLARGCGSADRMIHFLGVAKLAAGVGLVGPPPCTCASARSRVTNVRISSSSCFDVRCR